MTDDFGSHLYNSHCYTSGVGLVLKEDKRVALDGRSIHYNAAQFIKINPEDLEEIEREKKEISA